MIDTQIKYVADDFIRTLQSIPEVIEYLSVLNKYESNEELSGLTEKYYSLSAEFQKKQYDGTLTQPEIAELRRLVNTIQNNPLNKELVEKQNILKELLQEINGVISAEISMDFAKLAAPSTC
jgi:cell fate (sporulation/competence/biofilm development) regulator YlbF (YheA/YmcA/DUF963 family)